MSSPVTIEDIYKLIQNSQELAQNISLLSGDMSGKLTPEKALCLR